ncbi:VrtJ [Hirsutella rhossiliensis]|uniref:VrtJ n=1 Tax=Hirsutella rhossiliensis TaxID=111463 RepID=A0A9P8SGP0_9HYPO|nr:VrtJ [Hirsutella rhossiliensis]KAH0961309.1 VrtJ [Hirsutella rhossiliensis]
MPRRRELQAEDLASALRHLDEEFEAGERLANEQTWCAPVPRERQVRTVRRFYRAFHDAGTLPIATCTLCYRKRAKGELREMAWEGWSRSSVAGGGRSRFGCGSCFPEGRPVPVCVECARWAGREGASPAMYLHGRLGCEHAYPDELKDLTPLEEKLISLNSCYGFVTKYSIPGGQRQSVLPHPLLRVMDEIHVSWQGAERPGPRDLSGLLSENNPLYGEVEIDAAEMASWGAAARCRQWCGAAVGAGHGRRGAVEIEEVLAMLRQGRDPTEGSRDVGLTCEDDDGDGARPEEDGDVINEVTSSGMFPLDGAPEVADAEKIRFARGAVGPEERAPARGRGSPTRTPLGERGPSVGNQGTQAERVAEGLMSTRNMKLQAWESRLSMRKKILSLIIRHGVPAIWFTLNPNDITNLVKLRLAAHRSRDPDEAEAFLRDLGTAYKRTRLAISDPMSSAVFFHREMTLFFEHYVNVGEESVFGHVGAYYGAVETNERGALHIHGLLWLRGNLRRRDADPHA